MDHVTVAITVGLMAAGGALVYWPMSLRVRLERERADRLAAELATAKQDAASQARAHAGVVDEERTLAGALGPGADPDAAFGVLLDDDHDPTAPAGGPA